MADTYLSEISFKEKTSDWIEISVNSEIKSEITVKDDKKITEISPMKNIKYIIIHLKSPENQIRNKNTLHIYTPSPNLTGTTEEITIEQENKIIDSVCWKNSSPTKSELEDIKKLKLNGKCINSENVKKNQSIAKTSKGWEIFPHPTPGSENIVNNSAPKAKIVIQKGKKEDEVPYSINLNSESTDPDNDKLSYKWIFPNEIIEKQNPKSYRVTVSGKHRITLTVTDEYGASDTDTIELNALVSQKDLKSAKSLEKITEKKINPPPPKNKELPTWSFVLIFYTIFIILLLKKFALKRKPTSLTY